MNSMIHNSDMICCIIAAYKLHKVAPNTCAPMYGHCLGLTDSTLPSHTCKSRENTGEGRHETRCVHMCVCGEGKERGVRGGGGKGIDVTRCVYMHEYIVDV